MTRASWRTDRPVDRGARLLVVLATIGTALAGCAESPAEEDPDVPPAPPLWPFAFDATCDDATIAFLQELERLERLLPSGFRAADAADFLDAPTATGRGLVAITTADCSGSSIEPGPLAEAGVAILVERPRLSGVQVAPGAALTTYVAALVVTSETYYDQIAPWGHDIALGSVRNGVATPPQSGPMTITIDDDHGELATFTAVVPGATSTEREFVDNWQATSEGLLHDRIDLVARDFGAGTPVSCEIRAGSRMHEVFGFTSCEGQTALAIGAGAAPYGNTWTFFAGGSVIE